MKRVKLPKSLKIGGHRYEIVYPHTMRETDGLLGIHDLVAKRILVSERDFAGAIRPHSEILRTYFHEIFHAIDKIFCMKKLGTDGVDAEDLVEALAEGMINLLLENKWLYEIS